MNRILHNAPWVISVAILLFLAGFSTLPCAVIRILGTL